MKDSKIEWTDHTFNPWHGCIKVSAGCKNCYAETLDNRWKGGHWGPGSSRKSMSEDYWKQPLKWNSSAEKSGVKAKVFCASMADVFEGHKETIPHLQRLFQLIESTPHLVWQLLTKRPENILPLVPQHWKTFFPENVWIGTSVEDQDTAKRRIRYLLKVPAKVRFLSCEPLLEMVNIYYLLPSFGKCQSENCCRNGKKSHGIHWIIAGGESGPHARPMHPDWVRGLRNQAQSINAAFFFKQWGEYLPFCQLGPDPENTKAVNPGFPVRAFPSPHNPDKINKYFKCGKSWAGSTLDTLEYKEFPEH